MTTELPVRYRTRDGDVVDEICWRYYGSRSGGGEGDSGGQSGSGRPGSRFGGRSGDRSAGVAGAGRDAGTSLGLTAERIPISSCWRMRLILPRVCVTG